jgi:hypothetical protein
VTATDAERTILDRKGRALRSDANQPMGDGVNANQNTPNAVLRGRWLLAARASWVAVATLSLGLAMAGLVVAFNRPDLIRPPSVRAALQQVGVPNQAAILPVLLPLAATAAIGLLIFWRRSDDRAAMLFSLMLIAACSIPIRSEWPLGRAVPWLELPIRLVWALANFLILILLLVFPDGRFVPRWTRLLGVAAIPAAALVDLTPELSKARLGVTALIWSLFWGAGLYAQVYRYRHVSGPVQRQQTKWVALAFGLSVLFVVLGVVVPYMVLDAASAWFVWALPALAPIFALLPASVGIAILRHHLYDIDRLLSRTLTYGLLTVVLGLVYAGAVVVLGQALNPRGGYSSLAVAASTLFIAALFQPLRRRIQAAVDRRFNRRRYDAAKTIEAFSARLREHVDLDTLAAEVLGVVDQTMQPTTASLWLRPLTRAPQDLSDAVARRPAARPTGPFAIRSQGWNRPMGGNRARQHAPTMPQGGEEDTEGQGK